jgi:hypothetical protein
MRRSSGVKHHLLPVYLKQIQEKSQTMLRFLKIIFTRRWGWALIAALIVFGGGLWGWTSSTTPLLSGPTTTYTIAANALGDVCFITKDNSTFL